MVRGPVGTRARALAMVSGRGTASRVFPGEQLVVHVRCRAVGDCHPPAHPAREIRTAIVVFLGRWSITTDTATGVRNLDESGASWIPSIGHGICLQKVACTFRGARREKIVKDRALPYGRALGYDPDGKKMTHGDSPGHLARSSRRRIATAVQ